MKFVCYEKLFTLDNLRMKGDDWFIDKTVFGSEPKTVEVCIGKSLSWERLALLFPEAMFSESLTSLFVMKFDGLTFVRLKDDGSLGEAEFVIDACDEFGYWLLDVKTGERLCDSFFGMVGRGGVNSCLP